MTDKLVWEKLVDNHDNTYFEANSVYHVDGIVLKWRLRPRLECNTIKWRADHDLELMAGFEDERWNSLSEAKHEVQMAHENTLLDLVCDDYV